MENDTVIHLMTRLKEKQCDHKIQEKHEKMSHLPSKLIASGTKREPKTYHKHFFKQWNSLKSRTRRMSTITMFIQYYIRGLNQCNKTRKQNELKTLFDDMVIYTESPTKYTELLGMEFYKVSGYKNLHLPFHPQKAISVYKPLETLSQIQDTIYNSNCKDGNEE